ncbi:hypothetical protein [Marinicellulosiphila megalodicopiae]|uniref:hypothetical protein n=1 Tax=Marinicellulosiphila megalodicopiae TaxID=2724896 RepID=UPI003BB1BB60
MKKLSLLIYIALLTSCKGAVYIEFLTEKPESVTYIDNETGETKLIEFYDNILKLPLKKYGHFDLDFKYKDDRFLLGYCHFSHSGNNYMTLKKHKTGIRQENYLILSEVDYKKLYPEGLNKNDESFDYGSVDFNNIFSESHPKMPYKVKSSSPPQSSLKSNELYIMGFCLKDESTFSGYAESYSFYEELNHKFPFARK